MLNIDSLQTGIVIDHIEAGTSMRIYDLLDFIDPNITVDYIEDGHIVEKKTLSLPEYIKNVIKCKNPRCITTIEEGVDQVFKLCDAKTRRYRCIYCEQEYERPASHRW